MVIAIALPVTYVLALGSWYLVEKRALRLKGVLADAPQAPSDSHQGRRAEPGARPGA